MVGQVISLIHRLWTTHNRFVLHRQNKCTDLSKALKGQALPPFPICRSADGLSVSRNIHAMLTIPTQACVIAPKFSLAKCLFCFSERPKPIRSGFVLALVHSVSLRARRLLGSSDIIKPDQDDTTGFCIRKSSCKSSCKARCLC